jgi:hypothetical protein
MSYYRPTQPRGRTYGRLKMVVSASRDTELKELKKVLTK